MKTDQAAPFFRIIYHVLIVLVLSLAGVFIGGTIYSLLKGNNALSVSETPAARRENNDIGSTFTGIGRQRLLTSGSQSAVVVLTITFPYDPLDRFFSEELAARVNNFRSITADYFRTIRLDDLNKKNEEEIKNELLYLFNQTLRLGKINTLYFSDYMIIE